MAERTAPPSLSPAMLWQALVGCPEADNRRQFLAARLPDTPVEQIDQWVEYLKERVLETVYADIEQAQIGAQAILTIADLCNSPRYRAIGLRAYGHVLLLGRGEFSAALEPYDAALALHRELGDDVGEAQVQGTRIWALALAGRTVEALADGEEACAILEAHEQWLTLATVRNNLAAIYNRDNQFRPALAMVRKARSAYQQLGAESNRYLPSNALTEALILYRLGQLEEAVYANEWAIRLANETGQSKVVAQAQSNLAQVQFSRGNYTAALTLFDQAIRLFQDEDRPREAFLTELARLDGLLELRRFSEVLAQTRRLHDQLDTAGVTLEAAQVIYNEGLAYQGLRRYPEALAAFAAAADRFDREDNRLWSTFARLATGRVLLAQGAYADALAVARQCTNPLDEAGVQLEAAGARLLAAEAALRLGRYKQADHLLQRVRQQAARRDVPILQHQAYRLRGMLAQATGRPAAAIAAYDQAISALERLQGQLMREYRADFVADKAALYGEMVQLQLAENRPDSALVYAERAKSRALLDMLAHRRELPVAARSAADRELVERLNTLRAARDQLYRQWRGPAAPEESDALVDRQQVLQQHEQEITDIWHTLQIRNADYAREASLWQVQVEPAQPYLDEETLLLEYFVCGDRLVLFLVSREAVEVCRLPAGMEEVQQWLQRLALNLGTVPRSPAGMHPRLAANAQAILQKLYTQLLAPAEETLAAYSRLIIVPHGPLHYLPFHALHNGAEYLLTTHEISYLPGASFLRFTQEPAGPVERALVVGHSAQNRLPHAPAEAEQVAQLYPGKLLVEETATRPAVLAALPAVQVLHLATHAEFRADNPLFSGLALADGWLTTLDIFNLRLRAALVTLSACQTGLSVVGGGDELFGLMRAFLAAGAASLVLSLWAVEDQSTLVVMDTFYRQLSTGRGKAAALRAAQQNLLGQPAYAHPYFWAPFYLVGHTGPLA